MISAYVCSMEAGERCCWTSYQVGWRLEDLYRLEDPIDVFEALHDQHMCQERMLALPLPDPIMGKVTGFASRSQICGSTKYRQIFQLLNTSRITYLSSLRIDVSELLFMPSQRFSIVVLVTTMLRMMHCIGSSRNEVGRERRLGLAQSGPLRCSTCMLESVPVEISNVL